MALFWQGLVNKLENQNNIEQKQYQTKCLALLTLNFTCLY
jgi:hypothetical protein